MTKAWRVGISICDSEARNKRKMIAILKFPQNAATIKKTLLATCVKTMVKTNPITFATNGARNMLMACKTEKAKKRNPKVEAEA
jgi:hypothetical protein